MNGNIFDESVVQNKYSPEEFHLDSGQPGKPKHVSYQASVRTEATHACSRKFNTHLRFPVLK